MRGNNGIIGNNAANTALPALFSSHLERLKAALLQQNSVSYADWITQHTRLAGQKFSFKGHEYQKYVLDNLSEYDNVLKKCSQVGISEVLYRWLLCFLQIHPGSSLMLVMPTIKAVQKQVKTRIDPIIRSSPILSQSIIPGIDSSELKGFAGDSFLYFHGASGKQQAISIPLDGLIVDEENFIDDLDVLTSFTSRLTHSKHNKMQASFSTPTVPGIGVSAKYVLAKQHEQYYKCEKCGHWFKPDYFKHVRVREINGQWFENLEELGYDNRGLLQRLDLDTAELCCEKCGRGGRNWTREFIVVNPDTRSTAHGFHITPFCAPSFISPADLIIASTKYKNRADFYNFALGEDYEDETTSLTTEEVLRCFDAGSDWTGGWSVIGLDTGGLCHLLMAGLEYAADGVQLVVHRAERIPLAGVRKRYNELARTSLTSVVDSAPYTDLVLELQQSDQNCWAGVYSRRKSTDTELYNLKLRGDDPNKALYEVRQIHINRNLACSYIVEMLRAGRIKFVGQACTERDTLVQHLTSVKRAPVLQENGEMRFVWKKPADQNDHYFHALVYLVFASLIVGDSGPAGGGLPFLLSTFKVR